MTTQLNNTILGADHQESVFLKIIGDQINIRYTSSGEEDLEIISNKKF